MASNTILHIRQHAPVDGKHLIRLRLKRPRQTDLEAEATIEFGLTPQEQNDLRWYLEDYLQHAESAEKVHVEQIESFMRERGEELYAKMLTDNANTQAIWFAVREKLAELRIEITTAIAQAASIPWELMRDPQLDSAIALRVKSFVRVQSNPNISYIKVPKVHQGRVRLLYVVCRPSGRNDVQLRAVANRLLQDLGEDLGRYDIKALRPPTFEALQKELGDAKKKGRPYHIVHFDGHGVYADLKKSILKDWLAALNHLTLGGKATGKHGFLLFESPESEHKMRPVDGQTLGQLLHDAGVPILVLNACQSAMHEADEQPDAADTVHDEVRAIGSLAQSVVDQGIPAVLGMRYSVFVVTAAQYIGQLYRALATGSGFGEAASEGRKHLHLNPDRWVGLQPRPLQDWFVPIVYEAAPIKLLSADQPLTLDERPQTDPLQINPALLRYVPDGGFVGRDETLLMLDRAFDDHPIVLLHAYAGQGKTTTAVEFARWYAQTGGLSSPENPQPVVVLTSFQHPVTLDEALNGLVEVRSEQEQPLLSLLASQGKDWLTMNKPGQKRSEAVKLLRQIPVLWIWDNVEPVAGFPEGTESSWTAEEQAELAEFLKQLKLDGASKVKILLTSRRDEQKWLGGIPHRVQIPPMSGADAAGLALQLGEEKKLTRSQIGQWQPLLDYCAGNPLTLRVIAGQAVKMGLQDNDQIEQFIQAVRDGEQHIEDADEAQGRAKSLGASLDYGFRNAFSEDELPVIALLHLFQGAVDVDALDLMGKAVDHALPELQGRTKEDLAGLLERACETGLLTQIGRAYYTIHPALPWFLRQLFARHYDGQDGRSS
ncbi:MAG: CHAT domain-containing protein, partial [Planctomycetes bacterium]|nr:CHAT domain-containing protein [Planctomycetota bacterium]